MKNIESESTWVALSQYHQFWKLCEERHLVSCDNKAEIPPLRS